MGEDQFRFTAPGFAVILGADEDQVGVGVCVGDAGFAEGTAFGRAAKGDEEFTVWTANDRWERGVKLVVRVNDGVAQFAD